MVAQKVFVEARKNPFSVVQLDALGWIMTQSDWKALWDRLQILQNRGAIIGARGSGKTTLLSTLATQLRRKGRTVKALRLNSEGHSERRWILDHFLSSVQAGDFVLLDGAEQLSFFAWQRLVRKVTHAAGLIITGHHHGRLPCLIELVPSAHILRHIVQSLTELPSATVDQLATRYFQRYHGNLREALRAMYDDYPFEPIKGVSVPSLISPQPLWKG